MPELLTWLQDPNWPIISKVKDVVVKHAEVAEPHILEVLRGTDDVWKYNIIEHLLYEWPYSPDEELITEIARIAGHPTTAEVEDEVYKAAGEFMDELAKE